MRDRWGVPGLVGALGCAAFGVVACSTEGVAPTSDGGAIDGGGSEGGGQGGQGGGAGGSSGSGGSGGVGASGTGGSAGTCAPDGPGTGSTSCGSETCGPDEICVRPCCGGPAPPCLPLPEGGSCTAPNVPMLCDDGTPGCLEICTPPPPFCARAADIVCHDCDGPVPRSCDPPGQGCFGELEQDGRNLACTCA